MIRVLLRYIIIYRNDWLIIDRASKRSIAHLINLYHHKLVVVNCFSVFKLDVMFVHDHFDKCLDMILNEN